MKKPTPVQQEILDIIGRFETDARLYPDEYNRASIDGIIRRRHRPSSYRLVEAVVERMEAAGMIENVGTQSSPDYRTKGSKS